MRLAARLTQYFGHKMLKAGLEQELWVTGSVEKYGYVE